MAFQDYVNELVGSIPGLPSLHAEQLVNRAWGRILDFRIPWSFNVVADAQLWVPAAIVAGSVTVVNGSSQIVVDATAATALNAVAFANPPLASPSLGIGREIRIGTVSGISTPTGPNYPIIAWDGVNTLTINRPYGESSGVAQSYQVLKCFYTAPSLPFDPGTTPDQKLILYLSLTNRFSGYSISGSRLRFNQMQFNQIDPQRGGQGDSYVTGNYGRNELGQPVFEFYPNPANVSIVYSATYVTRWPDLTYTQDLPQMPYQLRDCLMFKSKSLGGDWALAHVGEMQALQSVNWVAYIQRQENEFKESLLQCIKVDDEIMPIKAWLNSSSFMFPLGGQFLQSHDVSSLIPGN
jgi:hypothetical protein